MATIGAGEIPMVLTKNIQFYKSLLHAAFHQLIVSTTRQHTVVVPAGRHKAKRGQAYVPIGGHLKSGQVGGCERMKRSQKRFYANKKFHCEGGGGG